MPPRVSIVMPTYNQSLFIKETLNSILCQTFKEWELIIVDDGSTDSTPEIIKPFLSDPRIKYTRKENGGTGSALNVGFPMATGQYETWMASDNVFYPHAFERLIWYLDNHPEIGYVYSSCDVYTMDRFSKYIVERNHISKYVPQELDMKKVKQFYFFGFIWMWRKEFRVKSGDFQKEPCEDYYFIFQMLAAGARFGFLDETLGWFRRHHNSMTLKIVRDGSTKKDPHYWSNKTKARGLALLEKHGVVV